MTRFEQKLIEVIGASRFATYRDLFLYASKTAYVNLELYDEYLNKQKKLDLARDCLVDAAYYLEKAVKTTGAIKAEATKFIPIVRTAINSSAQQAKISEALKYFVRIEKDWEGLSGLAASIERSGVSGKETIVRQDVLNYFQDIVMYADRILTVLSNVMREVESEARKL